MKSKSHKTKIKKHQDQDQNNKSTEDERSPEEFTFAVTKIAVAQICRSVGAKAAQSSALETLTVVAAKYLQELATVAASYSRAANRTESNLVDLTNGLHDMSSNEGFVGASTLHHQQGNCNQCLLKNSSVLEEIAGFVKYTTEIPFAKPIPRNRSVTKNWAGRKKGNQNELSSRSSHIPKWLPTFPNEGSFKNINKGPICNKSERLWENSKLVQGQEVHRNCGDVVQNKGGDLAKERGKVRFKIGVKVRDNGDGMGLGVDLRNGVCRGGKRVCWKNGDLIEEDEGQCGFKRRRRC